MAMHAAIGMVALLLLAGCTSLPTPEVVAEEGVPVLRLDEERRFRATVMATPDGTASSFMLDAAAFYSRGEDLMLDFVVDLQGLELFSLLGFGLDAEGELMANAERSYRAGESWWGTLPEDGGVGEPFPMEVHHAIRLQSTQDGWARLAVLAAAPEPRNVTFVFWPIFDEERYNSREPMNLSVLDEAGYVELQPLAVSPEATYERCAETWSVSTSGSRSVTRQLTEGCLWQVSGRFDHAAAPIVNRGVRAQVTGISEGGWSLVVARFDMPPTMVTDLILSAASASGYDFYSSTGRVDCDNHCSTEGNRLNYTRYGSGETGLNVYMTVTRAGPIAGGFTMAYMAAIAMGSPIEEMFPAPEPR